MNVSQALTDATLSLETAGVAESRREAGSLLSFALKRDRTFLFAHPEYDLSAAELAEYGSVVGRRAAREPYQYIVGRQEFYGLDFEVTPDVLIPRPDTEVLVTVAIERLAQRSAPRFLEIGVGSGCISVSVLHALPGATAVGVDLSSGALDVAGRNAAALGVADRLELTVSDLFSAIGETRFDAILSNPPYIPLADMSTLQAEVRGFEPHSALTDGRDGLSLIEKIVTGAPHHLNPRGFLALECGFGQSARITAMFAAEIWQNVVFIKDTNGIDRVAIAELGSK